MLVRTSIREPSRGRNRTNSKMGKGLVITAAKLSTLRCCVIEGEAQLTLDVLLKRSVRRPLSTSSRLSALLPVRRSRGIRATKIRPAMVVVPVLLERQPPWERPLWRPKLELVYCCRWVEGSRDDVGSRGGFTIKSLLDFSRFRIAIPYINYNVILYFQNSFIIKTYLINHHFLSTILNVWPIKFLII